MHGLKFPIHSEKIISAEAVDLALDEVALKISRRLKETAPIVISIMHGGLIFSAEMLKRFNFSLQQDYIHATRYKENMTGAELEWIKEPSLDIKQRTVLLIDDIFDEGVTLKTIHEYCYKKGADKVYSAVLIKKSKSRNFDYKPDFFALTAVDKYLFGMGMDYKGYWRNTRAVYALLNEEEESLII